MSVKRYQAFRNELWAYDAPNLTGQESVQVVLASDHEAEVASLRKDAERYRFLRDSNADDGWFIGRYPHLYGDVMLDWNDKQAVDNALDFAIEASSK